MKPTQKKLNRMSYVQELLHRTPQTFRDLCGKLEMPCTPAAIRALQRDFRDLTAQGCMIESNGKRPAHFRITHQPVPSMKPDEALAAHIALRLLYHHTSNPPQSYKNALAKILLSMPPEMQAIAQHALPHHHGSDQKFFQFEKIAKCWTERQEKQMRRIHGIKTETEIPTSSLTVEAAELRP